MFSSDHLRCHILHASYRYKDALHYGKDRNYSLNQHNKKMDDLDMPLTEGTAYYITNKKLEECKAKVSKHPELDTEVRL